MTSPLQENFERIRRVLHETAARAGRNPGEVRLIAVSKTKPAKDIQDAYLCGQTEFGENYVQELLQKKAELSSLQINWHFIGHLQKRKVKDLIGQVGLIHSIDSWELACEIDKRASQANLIQDGLLQIKLAPEESKSGLEPDSILELLKRLSGLGHVSIKGLMCLPPFFENPEESRPFFRSLRKLLETINSRSAYRERLTELSMGMSHDFTVAVEEGATLVRVGQALFGKRS